MKIRAVRVKETMRGVYVPQVKKSWSFGWQDFFDEEYTDDLKEAEENDDFNLGRKSWDTEPMAVACAERTTRRYVGSMYLGVVRLKPTFGEILRSFFQGPKGDMGYPGPPGPEGARGCKGDRGQDGRDARDLQCRHCNKYMSDYPRQSFFLVVEENGFFAHTCNRCEGTTRYKSFDGALLREDQHKEYKDL